MSWMHCFFIVLYKYTSTSILSRPAVGLWLYWVSPVAMLSRSVAILGKPVAILGKPVAILSRPAVGLWLH